MKRWSTIFLRIAVILIGISRPVQLSYPEQLPLIEDGRLEASKMLLNAF